MYTWLLVLIGLPKTAWKAKQQQGRIGRNGSKAIEVSLVFPQRGIHRLWKSTCAFQIWSFILGRSAPEAGLSNVMKGKTCIRLSQNLKFFIHIFFHRSGMNSLFSLSNTLGKGGGRIIDQIMFLIQNCFNTSSTL